MAISASLPPAHATIVDDETIALARQLEEIGLFMQGSKGKHPIGCPPDLEVAFKSFQDELNSYKCFLEDQRLAQSIAAAVHDDSAIIAEMTAKELQCHRDRRMAFELVEGSDEYQVPVHSELAESYHHHAEDDILSTIAETVTANSVIDFSDDEDESGPSMTFAERQAEVLKRMATQYVCSVCRDRYPSAQTIKVECEHRYCIDCAKGLFRRATKDETLFPPRCCKKNIDPLLVKRHMSAEEAQAFDAAAVEFSTVDRVYCSNRSCGRFVPPTLIDSGTRAARCEQCGIYTCAMCKNGQHLNKDCPEDPALRETRALAKEMGWQTCRRCQTLVEHRSGCNHMTCRCRAQFCYICGTPWKNCSCPVADENRIEERAEEVVDRDAEPDLPVAVRNLRVRHVQAQLRERHDCEHPGRFQRIFGAPRRGFQCEVCDARHWKYILQCRHCYLNACEDCRRHRI
ncbi:uncharacterized protein MYCFIDRAFT_56529 [Pseudocercospora fijiensis CIRAD86]|uniref:RBR-type E3 ubiquitin transferase n=1 Tax=Pseudocercospora fijiensis (strain CIRAD86) TaxID=383855 RepID=M2ZLK9_PSEFD|nr:uncharacterized protein MYCFIDRAFT_56529 [Pseudocercospora fijiensis CIRAD86]EME79959.1 hypothetical protein MYCFIDRAFT_56529 [Pseudocercospora fijiensis CIRAD86]